MTLTDELLMVLCVFTGMQMIVLIAIALHVKRIYLRLLEG